MHESILWREKELCRRSREAAALREKVLVLQDTAQHSESHWTKLLDEREDKLELLKQNLARRDALRGKLVTFHKVQENYHRLSKRYLQAQTEAKLLEDELHHPLSIHRWTLLQSANPELYHLLSLRTGLLDRLFLTIRRRDRLVDKCQTLGAALKRRPKPVNLSQLPDWTQAERQLQSKSQELDSLTTAVTAEKDAANLWLTRIRTKRGDLNREREQFFVTKTRESQPVGLVRDPPPLIVPGGQAPNAIIPKLRLLGLRPGVVDSASARAPDMCLFGFRVLPPLRPLESARPT
jgi:hypothetical protein